MIVRDCPEPVPKDSPFPLVQPLWNSCALAVRRSQGCAGLPLRSLSLPWFPPTAVPEFVPVAVYYVYLLCSANGTLYVAVTNALERRVLQHKAKSMPGFTKDYDVVRLVYFEPFNDIRNAIARERQIKRWRRAKKLSLIRTTNPKFADLSKNLPAS